MSKLHRWILSGAVERVDMIRSRVILEVRASVLVFEKSSSWGRHIGEWWVEEGKVKVKILTASLYLWRVVQGFARKMICWWFKETIWLGNRKRGRKFSSISEKIGRPTCSGAQRVQRPPSSAIEKEYIALIRFKYNGLFIQEPKRACHDVHCGLSWVISVQYRDIITIFTHIRVRPAEFKVIFLLQHLQKRCTIPVQPVFVCLSACDWERLRSWNNCQKKAWFL